RRIIRRRGKTTFKNMFINNGFIIAYLPRTNLGAAF
ncbi:unnamed protein product, partial [marine sediment metagenome]